MLIFEKLNKFIESNKLRIVLISFDIYYFISMGKLAIIRGLNTKQRYKTKNEMNNQIKLLLNDPVHTFHK